RLPRTSTAKQSPLAQIDATTCAKDGFLSAAHFGAVVSCGTETKMVRRLTASLDRLRR
ncbi:hypothetical protein E4U43_006198, partial [Claviceps pusilla]